MRATSRFKHIIQSDRPVLVDFYAEWCQPCKQVSPLLKQVKESFPDYFRVVKVNVDRNPHIAKEFQVRNIPTLILFQAGDIQWISEGVPRDHELTGQLARLFKQFRSFSKSDSE